MVPQFLVVSLMPVRPLIGLIMHGMRGLPAPILRFLMSWYRLQEMKIQWSSNCQSNPFNVSNGVCHDSVLSPVFFAVYLDGLLEELSLSGVGCYWHWMFAGVFCYADDLVLLAPCASALRTMLSICLSYAHSHAWSSIQCC